MTSLVGKSIERYELQIKLGEGGMAVVYKALDTRLKRYVALKLIRTEMFPPATLDQILERFKREATALARMQHANIVTVYDFGEYEHAPYLVMEYLPGGTLRQRIGQTMPYTQAAATLHPIANALAYAHSEGIVHRDVKPANILFSKHGTSKLSDFGIARMLDVEEVTQLTATGMGVGTPKYMAPEQWYGQVSPTVDVYALGIILYEMLSGHLPYTANTPGELLVKKATQPFPDLHTMIPDLPNAVVAAIQRALAQKPEDRFASMDEFAHVLDKLSTKSKVAVTEIPSSSGVMPVDQSTTVDDNETIYKSNLTTSDETVNSLSSSVKNILHRDQSVHIFPMMKAVGLGGLFFLLALCVLVSGFWLLRDNNPSLSWLHADSTVILSTSTATPPPEDTDVHQAMLTRTLRATDTASPTTIPSPTTTPTSKSLPEMILIPAGEFKMGCDPTHNGGYECEADELPLHTVYLDAYQIDKYEVTNTQYAQCVEAGDCTAPSNFSSLKRSSYYEDPDFANYPVVYVNWVQAIEYCTWAEKRLPTEAEWEKAARGDSKTNIFPWGDEIPDCLLTNMDNCVNDTSPIGDYPDGASPYGVMDMAGNVWEWVNDWYDSDYYQVSPTRNPTGPETGLRVVLRGGYFGSTASSLRVPARGNLRPASQYSPNRTMGFRCAMTVKTSE